MITSINGVKKNWNSEIKELWEFWALPKINKKEEVKIISANYFTPRPYLDQYNLSTDKEGFVFTVKTITGYSVGCIQRYLKKRKVLGNG